MSPSNRDDKGRTSQVPMTMGVGMALGAGAGTAIGAAIDSIALGLGIGVAIGAAVGLAWSQRGHGDHRDPPGTQDPEA